MNLLNIENKALDAVDRLLRGKTLHEDFYENLFRLYEPTDFEQIIEDVVYSRQDKGHPKLREHLASIVAILKLSKTPEQFKENVNAIHPRITEELAKQIP